jgi:hypothetical protein
MYTLRYLAPRKIQVYSPIPFELNRTWAKLTVLCSQSKDPRTEGENIAGNQQKMKNEEGEEGEEEGEE